MTLAGFTKKTDLDYEAYEKIVGNAQNWFMYQKSLLDVQLIAKDGKIYYLPESKAE